MSIKFHKVTDFFTGSSEHIVFELNGLFLCDEQSERVADLLASLAVNGAKLVRDWSGSGKRVAACRELMSGHGYACETRFDAAHGRRYLMACYPTGSSDKRRRALAALHGMRNTNPELSA